MKLFLSFICVVVLAFNLNAQNLHLNLFAGASNYNGDLQDKGFTLSQSHFAGGFGVSYDITDHFSVESALTFGTISANDTYGRNKARTLNFSSGISELNVGVQYFITPLSEHVLTPYVFAGLSVYHFNPYTTDTSGKKTFLRPLSTEGEGFIQGKNNYNLTQLAIPFGAGLKFSLSDNVNVGLEIGYRKLFTDYLDDVSGRYVDQSALLVNRGGESVELAYRGNELKNGAPYPAGGSIRGGSAHKDWYYFTGLTASFRLFTGNGLGSGSGKHSKYGCPANVN
jgi:opacity protein-like surface antigen